MEMNNIYIEKGFKNRREYLASLADEYGLDLDTVIAVANAYGPNEDFDGLIIALEDIV